MAVYRTANRLWNRALFIILSLFILAALGLIVYLATSSRVGDKFTEFYVLGPGGNAIDYPSQLAVGEEGQVIIGIINREQVTTTYRLAITIDGISIKEVGPVTVRADEEWQQTVGFAPLKPGARQQVEFLLYKEGREGVYDRLRLWIDVK